MEYNVLHCSLSTARALNMWNIPLILCLFHVLLKTEKILHTTWFMCAYSNQIFLLLFSYRFPPGVGVMVAGKCEARGHGPNDIRLTLKEEIVESPENDTPLAYPPESHVPVRLLGGRTNQEGRLQASASSEQG
jgi:hypothetical protein